MLFELLVLSGAQVGSDWTSILKKRQDFRWVVFFIKKDTELLCFIVSQN
jgi:3-methyladenine DNA glycosylase Tag